MSLTHNLIDEHKTLLSGRGYDENCLNSPDKPGTLFRQLSQYIGRAVNESLHDDCSYDFDLKAIGFFNNDTEMAFFQFKYVFDVKNCDLNLRGLIVRIDRAEKKFALQNTYDLPKLEDALKATRETLPVQKKSKTNQRFLGNSSGGLHP